MGLRYLLTTFKYRYRQIIWTVEIRVATGVLMFYVEHKIWMIDSILPLVTLSWKA
jgi:hypothetical protein